MAQGIVVNQAPDNTQVDDWAKVVDGSVVSIISADANFIMDPDTLYTADFWVDLTTAPYVITPKVGWKYDDTNNLFARAGNVVGGIEDMETSQNWALVNDGIVVGLLTTTMDFVTSALNQSNYDYWVNLANMTAPSYYMVYDIGNNTFSAPPTDGITEMTAKYVAIHNAFKDARAYMLAMQYPYNVKAAADAGNGQVWNDMVDGEQALWDSILGWLNPY